MSLNFARLFLWALVSAPVAFVSSTEASLTAPEYKLGPEDQISIHVMNFDEIPEKAIRIDTSGFVNLPLVGRIKAEGITVQEFETKIAASLMPYVREPKVSVNVLEVHSQPVSVLGAVNTPGVHQLGGAKTLVETISMAGGLRPDAGYEVQLTRNLEWGALPLPGAHTDLTGKYSISKVDLDAVMSGKAPSENILICPHDVVSIPTAKLVYVYGEVKKAGGFTLHSRETLSSLQALALAEGLEKTAAPSHAKIIRARAEGARQEIPVDLRKILDGRAADVPLQADDVLFVPNNVPRSVTMRTVETAIQLGTGILIFRR